MFRSLDGKLHHTEYEIELMSEKHKGQIPWMKGKIPWNKGLKGRVVSEETCKKLSDLREGKHLPEEAIRKSILSRTGKPRSESTRKKISNTRMGRYIGESNPQWKGGVSFEPYCPKFNNEFKERVRAFFGHTCQVCNHVWQPGERKLSVHHVKYNKSTCCDNSKPLFVPVCSGGCHAKTNYNREYWEEIFIQKIMLEYDGDCYLQKRHDT